MSVLFIPTINMSRRRQYYRKRGETVFAIGIVIMQVFYIEKVQNGPLNVPEYHLMFFVWTPRVAESSGFGALEEQHAQLAAGDTWRLTAEATESEMFKENGPLAALKEVGSRLRRWHDDIAALQRNVPICSSTLQSAFDSLCWNLRRPFHRVNKSAYVVRLRYWWGNLCNPIIVL